MMTRNLKVLGPALVAVFALSAVGASAASAAEFHAESAPVWVTANNTPQSPAKPTVEGTHKFSVTGGTFECTKAHFTSTTVANKTEPTLTMHPKYEGCTLGGAALEMKMNECEYRFHAAVAPALGQVDIVCPEGKKIEMLDSQCNLLIGSQTPEGGAEYINTTNGTERDVDIQLHVHGIVFTKNGGPLCVFLGGKLEYIGNATSMAYEDKGGTWQEPVEGATVNSWVE